MKINDFVQENYQEYIDDIKSWVDEQYDRFFKSCFDSVKDIHSRMKSQARQITDSELEWILTELPMELFSISENLNKIRLDAEVIKLRKKSIRYDIDNKFAEYAKTEKLTKSEVKNLVDAEMVEHDILSSAYSSLITRVESEISFSRELIMGCKKIWDSRRKAENSNPVGEVVPNTGDNMPSYYNSDRYHEPYIR